MRCKMSYCSNETFEGLDICLVCDKLVCDSFAEHLEGDENDSK